MTTLVHYLDSFNRKERSLLMGTALSNSSFRLSPDFLSKLSESFDLGIPSNAFAAMDYHLDWIHASLYLVGKDETQIQSNAERVVTGTQEDIDLLVAWDRLGDTEIILLEAKFETGWSNKQLRSKANHLRRIFGNDGEAYPHVRPHFGLMSPHRPQDIDTETWPAWMSRAGNPIWLELSDSPRRRRLARCDSNGNLSATGGHFRVHLKSLGQPSR